MSFEKHSKECPVVAILRGITPPEMLQVCEVLYDAGIRLLEVPLNSPDACASIKLAADKYHADGTMLIGAGTVLSVEDVLNVAAAGGKFIISPDTNSEVIAETKRLGLISIPGFFTPTEAFAATNTAVLLGYVQGQRAATGAGKAHLVGVAHKSGSRFVPTMSAAERRVAREFFGEGFSDRELDKLYAKAVRGA